MKTKIPKLTPNQLYLFYNYDIGILQSRLRIPASTLHRIAQGKAKVGEATKKKISNFLKSERRKERYAIASKAGLSARESKKVSSMSEERARKYSKLRQSGSRVTDALRISQGSKELVEKVSDRMMKVAIRLSKKHGVKLKHIIKGMSFSDRTVDDWEIYVSAKKRGEIDNEY